MQSKISLLNKGILKNDIKGFYWFPVLYFIVLVFFVPLQIIMRLPYLKEISSQYHYIHGILDFGGNGSQHILLMTAPVLLAILLFNYLQKKNPSDMIHSLPIKRKTLFTSHIMVGLGFLTLPVIATALVTWVIQVVYNLEAFFPLNDILSWATITIIINLVMFMSTVFVGTVTGISLVQGALTYIVLFLPLGLLYLVFYNMQIFLYGLNWRFYIYDKEGLLMALSPIYRIVNLYNNPGITELVGYSIFIVVLYFIGTYVYQKRKLENNMQPIVFNNLRYLFKYGVSISCMFTAGLYFASEQGSIYWILFGYVVASFLGYFIAEGILQKSVRVFNKKSLRSFGIYLGVIVVILLGINTDILGFEKNIPAADEIESIYFQSNFYYHRYNSDSNYYSDENIELIREIHKEIIMNKKHVKYSQRPNGKETLDLHFVYQLENGKKVSRSYDGIDTSPYKEKIAAIYGSMEYKKMTYDIFDLDPLDIEKVTLGSDAINKNLAVYSIDELTELLQLLKDEIEAASYEELRDPRIWGSIALMLKDTDEEDNNTVPERTSYDSSTRQYYKSVYIPWLKSFHNLDAWLFENDYLEKARIVPMEVHYMVVEMVNSQVEIDKTQGHSSEAKRYETYDKVEIDIGLQNYSNRWSSDEFPKFVVGFYNEADQQLIYSSIENNHVPQFILDFFQ